MSAGAIALSGCGGTGGTGSLDNPAAVSNAPIGGGQKLCFSYFQKCVNPIFFKQLGGNTCASLGCHDFAQGTGGAFRIFPIPDPTNPASLVDLTLPRASIVATDMYKNFYSAQAEVIIDSPTDSRLLNKPLLRSVLHGGGLIFPNSQDANAKTIEYWISHPAPLGQDEFGAACDAMFTPPNPTSGACN